MRSFFDHMTPWLRNEGSLHVYALPDDRVRERLVEASLLIDGVVGLPRMPESWLHMTVSRLAQFDDLPAAELTRLAAALGREVEGIGAFDIDFSAPWVSTDTVGCSGPSVPQWEALVSGVRRAASDSLGGELPAPPRTPHTSLAYAIQDIDDGPVLARLEGAPQVGPMRIDRVHLVSVTVRPEVGTFDWIELANIEL
ncbi:MAG: hypothetical protein IPJ61_07560 [Tessaracoccus sp.]|uniref:2'-5' RNA ligase family protein n=1 Tax=Tessaracoccus sp. TaxID=1971211 RepID=UPI001EC8D38E|nr:hypothetical protein [Tessaracoccus sp.]MBK7820929.1 hypothetical protein [Tessaracoccus sp.]